MNSTTSTPIWHEYHAVKSHLSTAICTLHAVAAASRVSRYSGGRITERFSYEVADASGASTKTANVEVTIGRHAALNTRASRRSSCLAHAQYLHHTPARTHVHACSPSNRHQQSTPCFVVAVDACCAAAMPCCVSPLPPCHAQHALPPCPLM